MNNMTETNEEMATIEEQPKERGKINGKPMFIEDTNGFKKEDVIETEGNATVNEVETKLPENDPTDVATEEIIAQKKESEESNNEETEDSIVKEGTTVKDIDDHQKNMLIEKAKASDIDWDNLEFEDEDKIVPKIDEETLSVFCAATIDFIDEDTIKTYVNIAKDEINEWLETKKRIEESGKELTNPDDLKYYETLTKTKDEARMVLASIQSEGKKIAKDFKENKIAESIIKSITLNGLKDFIVGKFKLTTTWDKSNEGKPITELDRSKEIQTKLLENMYVSPMFEEYVFRDNIKSKAVNKYNRFAGHYFNYKMDCFIHAIQSYIRNLDEDKQKNLDLKTVINRDFRVMEFFRILIIYAFKCNKPEFFDTNKLDETYEKVFKEVVDPKELNKEFTDKLYSKCVELMEQLKNPSVITDLSTLAKMNLVNDPLYEKVKEFDMNNYNDFVIKITGTFPEEVENTNIGKWSKSYIFLQKYERWYLFDRMFKVLNDSSIDETGKTNAAFNTMNSLLSDQFMIMYSEFVSDLQDFVISTIYTKESRPVMFSSIMNTMILQHELGFKTAFDPDNNSKGDGLYDLAKAKFGIQYDFIVGDKEDDILLKNVDLVNVHKRYITTLMNLVDGMSSDIKTINDQDVFEFAKSSGNVLEPASESKKKHKKRR